MDLESYNIPILLYHHLDPDATESGTVLKPETFERQMALLKKHGYTTVTFDDLIAFVENGKELPKKSVVITFDDGYYSNYEYAFPVLKKHGFKATIFAIGSSIGKTKYKDTQYDIIPHFGKEEINEMVDSGAIDVHSHTFDMHQWSPYEDGGHIRENILQLNAETEEGYRKVLLNDVEKQDGIFEVCGLKKSYVLAFPRGEYSVLANDILTECGYKVTLTIEADHINTIVQKDPSSLINLGRMNIAAGTSDKEILDYCKMNNH